MGMILSFTSLLLSALLLQLGSGALGPFDVLSGIELEFTGQQIGLLGSAHFIGFFIGCWVGPRLIGLIGHSRSFAVFAAAGTIGILLHMIIVDPWAWAFMRILTGVCVSGSFTVIEAWLQAKANNQNRGRTLGIYRVVELFGSGLAQLMITFLSPAHYIAYNILAIICCASLLPLVLTRLPPPVTPDHLRLRPMLALRISPMATAGVVVAGLTTAGFRMVGPFYASRIGLEISETAMFLAFYILGGALAQYPTGWLADKIDRRQVLVLLSMASVIACFAMVMAPPGQAWLIFICSAMFGFATYPIYSVAAAHANDHSPLDSMVELSASLLFFFAAGAIASPLLLSGLVVKYDNSIMFVAIGAAHVLLAIIGGIRMVFGRQKRRKTSYVYMPRTSFLIGRLLRYIHKQNGK